jgi:hypothetical protein
VRNISDEDDDGSNEEEEVEVEQNIFTREVFLSHIDASSYGHSQTMNTTIKIISQHPVFHKQCHPRFVVKLMEKMHE